MSNTTPDDQHDIQRRDAILSAVGFAAHAFLQSADWHTSMNAALERLGTAVAANRAYYFENHVSVDGVQLTSQRSEWVAEGISSQIDNPDLQNIPWVEAGVERWLHEMRDGKPIVGLIADFPESERAILEAQQIQSLIALPVFVAGQLSGFVGFDDCETLREWSAAEFDALLAATTSIGAALERQQLERQLRFAQKMEAIGSLAAGVAHDFNNILQAITAFTQIAKMKITSDNTAHDDLREVLLAAERAHGLTRQLLAFSRKQEAEPTNVNLNQLCQSVLSMVRPLLGKKIRLNQDLAEVAPVVHADSGLIGQVLLNLCLNARDAMPKGGLLEVRCDRRTLDQKELDQHNIRTASEYAVISVKDNGDGMSTELRQRIFEPFFTTKEVGQGTGLGLSVVYGSVQQSGGFIKVHSKPGFGSQFEVFLPVVAEEANPTPSSENVTFGTETILIVDDEPLVLDSHKRLIQSLGYKTLTARDGTEGLDVFRNNAERISLILTDTVMPNMDGYAFRDAVMKIDQHVKVIMLSGYTPEIRSAGDAGQPVVQHNLTFLQKPVSQTLLAISIRRLLDTPPAIDLN